MEDFYVTFGVQYGQSVNSERHPLRMQKNGYAVIEAVNLDAAHESRAGCSALRRAFVYDYEHFIADGTAASVAITTANSCVSIGRDARHRQRAGTTRGKPVS